VRTFWTALLRLRSKSRCVLGRLDAGKMAFEPAPIDLAVFCHRAVDEVLSATNRVCPINLALVSLTSDAPLRQHRPKPSPMDGLATLVKRSYTPASFRTATAQLSNPTLARNTAPPRHNSTSPRAAPTFFSGAQLNAELQLSTSVARR